MNLFRGAALVLQDVHVEELGPVALFEELNLGHDYGFDFGAALRVRKPGTFGGRALKVPRVTDGGGHIKGAEDRARNTIDGFFIGHETAPELVVGGIFGGDIVDDRRD